MDEPYRFPPAPDIARGRRAHALMAVAGGAAAVGFTILLGVEESEPGWAWVLPAGGAIWAALSWKDSADWRRLGERVSICSAGADAVLVPVVELPETSAGVMKFEAPGPGGGVAVTEASLDGRHGAPVFGDDECRTVVALRARSDGSVVIPIQESGYPFQVSRAERAALLSRVLAAVPEEVRTKSPAATPPAPRAPFTAEFPPRRSVRAPLVLFALLFAGFVVLGCTVFGSNRDALAVAGVNLAIVGAVGFVSLRLNLDRLIVTEESVTLRRRLGRSRVVRWEEIDVVTLRGGATHSYLRLLALLAGDLGRFDPPEGDPFAERLRGLGMGSLGRVVLLSLDRAEGTQVLRIGTHFGWNAAHRLATEADARGIHVRFE